MATQAPKKKSNEGNQDYLKRCTKKLIDAGESQRSAFSKCAANLDEDFTGGLRLASDLTLEEKSDGGPRKFMLVAKTGEPWDRWYGKLVIDIKGMRLEPKIPVLRQHMADRVVGHGQGFKENDELMVEGEFSQVTEDAKEVLALADEGYPWQASIGVWAEEITSIEAGVKKTVNGMEIEGPADIWVRSHVREVSFVTLGADPGTAAISLDSDNSGGNPPNINSQDKGVKPMNLEELKKDHPEIFAAARKEGYDDGVTAGIAQERARVTEIMEADAAEDATMTAIKNGTEVSDAYKDFFEAERKHRKDGLDALANQATPPQGQDNAADGPGDGEASLSADKIVAKRAKEVMEEKGISIEQATKKALADDPGLREKYRAMFVAE